MNQAGRAYAQAEEKIERAIAKGATELRLTGDVYRALQFIPERIAGFNELQWLDVNYTKVADLAPLAGLTGLQRLDLGRTRITDLSSLAKLTGLQWLYLNSTQVADIAPLAGLKELQVLDCNFTQVADLASLAGLSDLRTLYVNGTPVADLRPVAHMSSLLERREDGLTSGLYFMGCLATTLDPKLRRLSEIQGALERTEQTLAYLRSLPPWPEPLPWLDGLELDTSLEHRSESDNARKRRDKDSSTQRRIVREITLSEARKLLEQDYPVLKERAAFAFESLQDAIAYHQVRIPNDEEGLAEHRALLQSLTFAQAMIAGIHESVPEGLSDREVTEADANRLKEALNMAVAQLQAAADYIDQQGSRPTYGGLLKIGCASAVGGLLALIPGLSVSTAIPGVYAALYGKDAAAGVIGLFKSGSSGG